jgi:tryptophan synthase alpha chain
VATVDRLGDRLKSADARHERLLVVYLTVADSLADTRALALAVAAGGADVLELGIPTPHTRPRGADMAASFDRARGCPPDRAFEVVAAIRSELPELPLLALAYPQTVADVGVVRLPQLALRAGLDGVVLTTPDGPLSVGRVAATGLSAVPLVPPDADPAQRRRWEESARHLTYRPLAGRTGVRLEPAEAGRTVATAARSATKPFLAGFGIRDMADIRAVARYAAGVVIGSQLYRCLADLADPAESSRVALAETTVRRWKTATVLADTDTLGGRNAH